ncbi:MAG: CHRD domain-containing protein, partial [Pyrinomonadaceae bacterium]
MKTSRAHTTFLSESRNRNGSNIARQAIMLARTGISAFEIRETRKKGRHQVFLPALALALLCLMSVNTAQAAQRFAATLTGAQETPPSGSAGTGYGSVILSDDQTMITVNMGFTG